VVPEARRPTSDQSPQALVERGWLLFVSRRISLVSLAVCISLVALPAAADATPTGEPATVKVRVEGFGGKTLLAQTEVTTTSAPVPVEGGTCSGTSAGGALYDAVHGVWHAKLGSFGVEVLGIGGVELPSFGGSNYAYWAFWLNNEFASEGACEEQVSNGADIVFEGQCFAEGPECGSSASAPDHFLTATAPAAQILNVGESASVKVGSLSTESGTADSSLPAGVVVSAGSQSAAPGAGGVASLKFDSPGTFTLQATAPDSVPSDPYKICVHNGSDGNCGTVTPTSQAVAVAPAYKGPFALVAETKTLIDGHFYAKGKAPRVLEGKILAHNTVSSISLELRREYKGRCYAYDGVKERFVKAHCYTGTPFVVSSSASFSYQLPAALAPGRYVLDIQASDAAGNHTSLARGTSRLVFYVR
jgi:hypothetical protein